MAYVAHLLKNGQDNIKSRKFKSDHEIFIMKIYFNANLEEFTKFLNHESLKLYSSFCIGIREHQSDILFRNTITSSYSMHINVCGHMHTHMHTHAHTVTNMNL